MESATSFSTLETVATIESIERIGKILERLYRAQVAAFWVVVYSFFIPILALQVRWKMARVGKIIGLLVIETDEDRSRCANDSAQFLTLSKKIDEAQKKCAGLIAFSSLTQRFLNEAADFAEDASETLSLAASLEFKNLLDKSLAINEIP